MVSSLRIRQLDVGNEKEKSDVISLVNECYRGNKNWTNECEIVRGERTNSDKLSRDLEDMTLLVAVAPLDGAEEKIVGCIKTGIVSTSVVGPLSVSAGHVGLFAVHPESGGMGVGTKLLAAAEHFCATLGAQSMVMDVLDRRRDIMSWYNRKGYEAIPSESVSARDIIASGGEELLVDCNFIRMRKNMVRI